MFGMWLQQQFGVALSIDDRELTVVWHRKLLSTSLVQFVFVHLIFLVISISKEPGVESLVKHLGWWVWSRIWEVPIRDVNVHRPCMVSRCCRNDSAFFHWTFGNYYLPIVHLPPPHILHHVDIFHVTAKKIKKIKIIYIYIYISCYRFLFAECCLYDKDRTSMRSYGGHVLFGYFSLLWDMKHATSMRWLANLDCAVAICLVTFRAHMNILIFMKVKIFVLIKWSYNPPPPPPFMLIIESWMVSIF